MSFRIKTTHELLKQQVPVEQAPVVTSAEITSFLDSDKTYVSFLDDKKSHPSKNTVTQGSNVGMAIRTIPSAQADYM